MLKHKRRF